MEVKSHILPDKDGIATASLMILAVFILAGCVEKPPEPEQFIGDEPTGGQWSPIVLESNDAVRLQKPPVYDSSQFTQELKELHTLQAKRTAQVNDTVNFWNEGASVRWNEIARDLVIKYKTSPPKASRVYALLSVAQYDSLVASWNNKYYYKRHAPQHFDKSITALVETISDPAYPSEHAAVAAASAEVLAYLYPNESHFLEFKAKEHEESRLWAGVNFRSDIVAGDWLGREVAKKVIEYARTDNSDAAWTGNLTSCPGGWFSSEDPPKPPVLPRWSKVKPWLVRNSSHFMPPPPPALGSHEFNEDLAKVRRISDTLTPEQIRIAEFWADGAGTYTPPGHWNSIACDYTAQYQLNELRSARALALMNTAVMDAGICCWESKYTYCLIRPSQVDENITLSIPLPNFPSYVSGHSSFSGAASEVLAYIFPEENESLHAMAEEAGISRVYGGVHYFFDSEEGLKSGRAVAQLAIERGMTDGSP